MPNSKSSSYLFLRKSSNPSGSTRVNDNTNNNDLDDNDGRMISLPSWWFTINAQRQGRRRHPVTVVGWIILAILTCILKVHQSFLSSSRTTYAVTMTRISSSITHQAAIDTNHAMPITANLQNLQHGGSSSSEATPVKIAYAITITHCPHKARDIPSIVDAPQVLARAIQRLHASTNETRTTTLYDLIAFVSTKAIGVCCCQHLQSYGYQVLPKELPVDPETEFASDAYREHVADKHNGCCGAYEFLKLYAWTLTDYDVVVHMDVDVLPLQPLNELMDLMVSFPSVDYDNRKRMMVHQPNKLHSYHSLQQPPEFLFTRDYLIGNKNVASDEHNKFAVQGGFFLVRPNRTMFEEMRVIIRRSNFTSKTGWEGSLIGNFVGDSTIQGLLSYVYSEVHPELALELNPCIYNNLLNDLPFYHQHQDCRKVTPSEVMVAHFANAKKPWMGCWCPPSGRVPKDRDIEHINSTVSTSSGDSNLDYFSLCEWAQQQWFDLRREVEETQERHDVGTGTFSSCWEYPGRKRFNHSNYIPMKSPDLT